jgi:hypothetical protein
MTATAPLDRIEPADVYRQIDWLRDEWSTNDEYQVAQKITRLRRTLEHLPSRYYELSLPLMNDLCGMRLRRDPPYQECLRRLVELVREWDRQRPPLLECPDCGIEIRGHRPLATHRSVVHDVWEADKR